MLNRIRHVLKYFLRLSVAHDPARSGFYGHDPIIQHNGHPRMTRGNEALAELGIIPIGLQPLHEARRHLTAVKIAILVRLGPTMPYDGLDVILLSGMSWKKENAR
jgi:hypothetical protein